MTTLQTARHALPLLAAGQAHKELFHNEALALLDFLINSVVINIVDDPGALNPTIGDCWLIGSTPVGEWQGKNDQIAGWSAGGWRYIAPLESMEVLITVENRKAIFRAGVWQSIGLIAEPSGGAAIDQEARQAIDSILFALQTHGILPSVA